MQFYNPEIEKYIFKEKEKAPQPNLKNPKSVIRIIFSSLITFLGVFLLVVGIIMTSYSIGTISDNMVNLTEDGFKSFNIASRFLFFSVMAIVLGFMSLAQGLNYLAISLKNINRNKIIISLLILCIVLIIVSLVAFIFLTSNQEVILKSFNRKTTTAEMKAKFSKNLKLIKGVVLTNLGFSIASFIFGIFSLDFRKKEKK